MLNGKEVNKMTLTQKHQRNLRKELIRERRSNIIGNLAKTALVIGIFVGASIGVGKFAYTGIKRLEDNVIISSYNETVNNPITKAVFAKLPIMLLLLSLINSFLKFL